MELMACNWASWVVCTKHSGKQVPEKCPLLATAPTLSLEQDGPIGFLRVKYLWANIQVEAANRLWWWVIRRLSHLAPPFYAIYIQPYMGVHSPSATKLWSSVPNFFLRYGMSRHLPWGAPKLANRGFT